MMCATIGANGAARDAGSRFDAGSWSAKAAIAIVAVHFETDARIRIGFERASGLWRRHPRIQF
jgi:hypothetical protein